MSIYTSAITSIYSRYVPCGPVTISFTSQYQNITGKEHTRNCIKEQSQLIAMNKLHGLSNVKQLIYNSEVSSFLLNAYGVMLPESVVYSFNFLGTFTRNNLEFF